MRLLLPGGVATLRLGAGTASCVLRSSAPKRVVLSRGGPEMSIHSIQIDQLIQNWQVWGGKAVALSNTVSPSSPYMPLAPWLRRAFPGPWWSKEKAFRTRSSRLLAKAEALGSIHYKLRVDVDERSAGGWRLEAVSRPRTASLSGTSNRGTRGRYGIHGGSLDEIRCVLHLPLTLIITHFCAASVLAGSC